MREFIGWDLGWQAVFAMHKARMQKEKNVERRCCSEEEEEKPPARPC